MSTEQKPRGTWTHRLAIRFFTLCLTILLFWVLGFLVDDIRTIRGPDYRTIEKQHVDATLVAKTETLTKQIAKQERKITAERENQSLVGDSSRNLQQTINQLLEIQRLSMEKSITLSNTEKSTMTDSLGLFLGNQRRYQALNRTISDLVEQQRSLEAEKRETERLIDEQRKPARAEYERLQKAHRLKLACIQLAILLPLLAIAAALLIKKRASIYFPLLLAFGIATLLKVGLVMHEYFPSRYFKYILIAALLIAVIRILAHFIRAVAFPKTEWLVKQYRDAYERFLCPVCEYPIRTGPRRFLYWTRRTVNKIVVPQSTPHKDTAHSCPACGTALFEECPSCHGVRHSLLPHCRHCGATKENTHSVCSP